MEVTNQEIHQAITTFKEVKIIKGIVVPLPELNKLNKTLREKGITCEIPNHPRIIPAEPDTKIILLRQDIKPEELERLQEILNKVKHEFREVPVQLNYKNFDNQQQLNWFTKENNPEKPNYVHFPGSFETIGHIAHYNLTEQQQKWKLVIGQITLLKCPNIKTVVNKTEKLHNVYRTPTLEHMAGEVNYEATLKERGVEFKINFQKVYWCSRLQQERDRLLEIMRPGQLLADIFCGVGPLAVRAAKKNLFVIANDLNPYCHEYLVRNATLNKVEPRMICWNMCARQAMRKIYKESSSFPLEFQLPDHIYMNLPVDAIEFLDVLVDYDKELKTKKMPLVHVNCFVVADSDQKSKELLSLRVQKVLPSFKPELIQHMHHIKNVTVIMRMYCLTFRLPLSGVDLGQQPVIEEEVNGDSLKRQKVE